MYSGAYRAGTMGRLGSGTGRQVLVVLALRRKDAVDVVAQPLDQFLELPRQTFAQRREQLS